MQQYLEPPPNSDSDSIEIGDHIEVLDGKHMGKHGIMDWYAKGLTNLWFHDVLTQDSRETSFGLSSISVPVAMVQRTSLTHTIQYTKDKGYDVRPGDVMTGKCSLLRATTRATEPHYTPFPLGPASLLCMGSSAPNSNCTKLPPGK